jgi:hypothetical protein
MRPVNSRWRTIAEFASVGRTIDRPPFTQAILQSKRQPFVIPVARNPVDTERDYIEKEEGRGPPI